MKAKKRKEKLKARQAQYDRMMEDLPAGHPARSMHKRPGSNKK